MTSLMGGGAGWTAGGDGAWAVETLGSALCGGDTAQAPATLRPATTRIDRTHSTLRSTTA